MKTADEKVWHASPTCRNTTSTYNHYRKLSLLSPKLHIPIKIFHFPLHFSRFSQAEDLVFIPSDGRFSWLTHLDFNFLGFFHIWSMLRELLLGLTDAAHLCCSWSNWGPSKGPDPNGRERRNPHIAPVPPTPTAFCCCFGCFVFLLAKLLC